MQIQARTWSVLKSYTHNPQFKGKDAWMNEAKRHHQAFILFFCFSRNYHTHHIFFLIRSLSLSCVYNGFSCYLFRSSALMQLSYHHLFFLPQCISTEKWVLILHYLLSYHDFETDSLYWSLFTLYSLFNNIQLQYFPYFYCISY